MTPLLRPLSERIFWTRYARSVAFFVFCTDNAVGKPLFLHVRDVLGEIHIARQDAEICVAAENEINFLFGEPFGFLFQPVDFKLEHAALRG